MQRNKQNFFVTNQTPLIKRAADLAALLGQRPTTILGLAEASEIFRINVDYILLRQARERLSAGKKDSTDETVRKIEKAYKEYKKK